MRKYNIHLPLGTLAFVVLEEYPTSFFDIAEPSALVLAPTNDADFVAFYVNNVGSRSYLDTIAAMSYYFSVVRGIPGGALDVLTDFGRVEIPSKKYADGRFYIPLPPTTRVLNSTVSLLGGVSAHLSTVCEHSVSRVIENVERCSAELLSRLRVIDGLPNADRAICYKRTDFGYGAMTTDKHATTDSISPIAHLLSLRGEPGELSVALSERKMNFYIPPSGAPYALYKGITHDVIYS